MKWFGHASFMLTSGKVKIFVDPFRIESAADRADVIFITHPHFDHMSEDDIEKVASENTTFVAPLEAAQKLSYKKIIAVMPGDRKSVLGIDFEVIRSYNIGKEFHKKSSNWVGYIIIANGKRIYFPGDTDLTEEMKDLDVDLALLPCGGKFTMNIDDAIKASKVIRAKHFAPIHYKALLGVDGSRKLEERFRREVKNSIILEEVQEPYYSF